MYVFCWVSFESIDDTSTLTSISKVHLFMYFFFSMSSVVCVLFFWLLEFDACVILWCLVLGSFDH